MTAAEPRRWHQIAALVQSLDLRNIIEVGCKDGQTTAFLLEHCPNIRVTAIDPYCQQPDNANRIGGETYEDWNFADIEQKFFERVAPWSERVTLLKTTSREAAGAMLDSGAPSADLVFIDAAHDEQNVIEDISAWRHLVRPGGILCGHDYQQKFPGVMRAVARAFCLLDVRRGADSMWMVQIGEKGEAVTGGTLP